jgi:type IV pilus assembly protein PilQ
MGVKVSYGHEARVAPPGWLVAGLMALWIVCAFATATSAARPTGQSAADSSVLSRDPLEIRSLDLREGAPGLFLDVMATGPVVWTSFRDADGRLIVELPNTEPAQGVTGLNPAKGLVAAVGLERDVRANRPVTRLTIQTRQPVEHSLSAEGGHLEVSLSPLEGTGFEDSGSSLASRPATAREPDPSVPPVPSYEPLPKESPQVPPTASARSRTPSEVEPRPVRLASLEPLGPGPEPTPLPEPDPQEPAQPTGTAENPVVAPPPSGAPATRLEGVEVISTGEGTALKVLGDGEFRYSFFSLDNPERFVIDLDGVVNQSRRSAVQVGSPTVERVRIAQFKPFPEPVSRVVFDLNRSSVPRVERTSDGLVVRFNGGEAPSRMAETGEPETGAPEEEGLETVDVGESTMAGAEDTTATTAEGTGQQEQPVASIQGSQQGVTLDMEGSQEPRRVAEPAPRVAAPPVGDELEVFQSERQEEEPRQERIRREQPSPAAAVPSSGNFDVQTVGESETRYVGEPIDMSVREADVVEVLRMFAEISGLNVVIQPGIRGTVTVELNNVPWDQALEQVLKINGLGFELEGNIMRIAPTEQLRREAQERQALEQAKALSVPLNTIIKRLSYANANQVATLLQSQGGVLSQRGSVIVDPRTNTMIIKELPDFMDAVIAIIETLDTPEPQVMIEARIVETSKRFSRTLGISWGFLGEASPELGTNTGLEFPNNINADGGVNLLTGGDNAFLNLTLGNVLNSFVLDARLQAAEDEGLINILSAPKVATLNNQSASIQSGLQIPVQTVANNTVTVQFVNATLELQVTPQVTAEGTILMDINISKREPQLAFAVQGAANAPISTKEASTRVIVRDGGTTVIGGIYEVSSDQGEDRVPGLANIPIIGHLFRNKRRTDENEELLIFITPRVINL